MEELPEEISDLAKGEQQAVAEESGESGQIRNRDHDDRSIGDRTVEDE